MTSDHEIERLLDRWLADGPRDAPDRVLTGVSDRIVGIRQRPVWRLDRRHTMRTMFSVAGAAAAVIVVAIAGYALLRPAGPNVGGGTTATPSVVASPTPTPTARGFSCLGGSPCLGHLTAGRHKTTDILTPFSYVVPEGWENPAVNEGSYMLQRQGSIPGSDDAIYVWPDPVVASQTPTNCSGSPRPEPGIGRTVDDLVAWLAAHPGLVTTDPAPVSIGGLEGVQLDVRKEPDWTGACGDQVELFVHSGTIEDPFWWAIADDGRSRFFFLDAGDGRVVLIDIETVAPETFESFTAQAMPIVESFDFTPAP